jgi:hypothetical protein
MAQNKMTKIKLVVVFGGLFLALNASAAPLCTTGSLQSFIDLGACQIGDKIFSDFFYSTSPNGTQPDAAAVTVTPITTAYNPGVVFQAPWSAVFGQSFDFSITFNVTVVPGGNLIEDASLGIGGLLALGTGTSVAIIENICTGATATGCVGGTPYTLFDVTTPTSSSFGDHVTFAPVTKLRVEKDLRLTSGPTGFAELSILTQQFSSTNPAPEPASQALIGLGLLAVAGIFRRRGFRR